jgi:hypothetical protein
MKKYVRQTLYVLMNIGFLAIIYYILPLFSPIIEKRVPIKNVSNSYYIKPTVNIIGIIFTLIILGFSYLIYKKYYKKLIILEEFYICLQKYWKRFIFSSILNIVLTVCAVYFTAVVSICFKGFLTPSTLLIKITGFLIAIVFLAIFFFFNYFVVTNMSIKKPLIIFNIVLIITTYIVVFIMEFKSSF